MVCKEEGSRKGGWKEEWGTVKGKGRRRKEREGPCFCFLKFSPSLNNKHTPPSSQD